MHNKQTQKVLKVKLYQETAVYRNPLTMEVIETFPLPAPSTVIGFLHALMGLNELSQKIDISIQGNYGSIYRDYQLYVKGKDGLSSLSWQRIKSATKPYPIIVNVLHDINLTIHINGSEELLRELYNLLTNPPFYPHLGRAEDLVKIESVEIVNISEIQKDWFPITTPTYIQSELAKNLGLQGILYSLPTYFKFKQIISPNISERKSKKQSREILIRDFFWQDYIYVENDFIETEDKVNIIIDEEGCPVWWLMPNPHPLDRTW